MLVAVVILRMGVWCVLVGLETLRKGFLLCVGCCVDTEDGGVMCVGCHGDPEDGGLAVCWLPW